MHLIPTSDTLAQRADAFCELLLQDLGLSIVDVQMTARQTSFSVRTWQGVSAIVGRARLSCEIDIKGQLPDGRWRVTLKPKAPC